MELKHSWTPEHAHVISGLKTLLAKGGFVIEDTFFSNYTDRDYMYFQQGIFSQMRHDGKGQDPVHSWEQMLNSAFLSSRHHKKDQLSLFRIMLVQALIYLFSQDKNAANFERYDNLCDFLLNDEPKISCCNHWNYYGKQREWQEKNHIPWVPVDQLVVRLQPDFMECLRQKDIAKLRFMLDFLSNPGEKPKNISFYLLNQEEYALLPLFGDPSKHFAKVKPTHLKCLWFNCLDRTEEEKAFSRAVFPLLKFHIPWQELHEAKRLSHKLDIMLDNGISPDCKVYSGNRISISLDKYLLFLDEIREELAPVVRETFTLRDDLAASEKYVLRISNQA